MTFGEKLQALRQRAGMSQDTLAERLNVSRQAVSRWERDETMPETDKVVALADIFGVTTDYLLRPEEQQARRRTSRTAAAQPRQNGTPSAVWDIWQKPKGYLLGWVLIAWGVLDLVTLVLMGLGVC